MERDLDDELVVVVVDNEVHTRQADHFVELVPAFVDAAVTRHERAYFIPTLLHRLRESAAKSGAFRLWKIRGNLPDRRTESYLPWFECFVFGLPFSPPGISGRGRIGPCLAETVAICFAKIVKNLKE